VVDSTPAGLKQHLQRVRHSPSWMIAAGFSSIPLLGVLNWLTGEEISFSIVYLLPIYLIAWHGGLALGLTASTLAAVTWLAADDLSGHVYSVAWYPYWNMLVRFGFFLVTTLLVVRLVQSQSRRRFLERLFFHDLLNLAGSLRGFAELLQDETVPDHKEVAVLLERTADRIIEEIETQQVVSSAESGELVLQPEHTSGCLLLQNLVSIYRFHPCAEGREIVLTSCPERDFVTDQGVLIRILGNLLKNALEATPRGGRVELACYPDERGLEFQVRNPGAIPEAVHEHLFSGSFSTKGAGRGMGLNSIRLLVAALQGEVEILSNTETGTCFMVRIPELVV